MEHPDGHIDAGNPGIPLRQGRGCTMERLKRLMYGIVNSLVIAKFHLLRYR